MKQLIESVKSKILDFSGILVGDAQLASLQAFLESKAALKKLSPQEYVNSLLPYTPDFDELINNITVNETYFFREEKQFDFLKEKIFPKFIGKKLSIWSCSCSTGEEAISLLSLALSMNIDITLYASDINDNALAKLRAGHFSFYSLRDDGKKYHELLDLFSTRTKNELVFNPDFLSRIQSFKFNLFKDGSLQLPFAENVDIIFIRNVFIYFDKETRNQVVKRLTDYLKKDGMLFFSVSEVGSIDESGIENRLTKTNDGEIYYFIKNPSSESSTLKDISRRKKNEYKLAIEKAKRKKALEQTSDSVKAGKESLKKQPGKASKDEADFDINKIYEEICKEISAGDFEKAHSLASSIKGSSFKKYSFFLQGYVEYHAENKTAAELHFASTESLSPDFWPAFFYHGMLLRDLKKTEEANKCFSKCKEIIAAFKTDVPYDFTLDSFSPAYICSLCETFTKGDGRK